MNHRSVGLVALFLMIWVAGVPAATADDVKRSEDHARKAYLESRRELQAAPNSPAAGWQFARATFELAEFAGSDKKRRSDLALRGISVCEQFINQHTNIAELHYYLAMNYGQLARTKTLGALKLVKQMRAAFEKSLNLDPKIDFAGAHRNLGILYRDAPGWPTSIGNRKKSRLHLHKSIEIAPRYPGNRLIYLESLLEWSEPGTIRKDLPTTEAILKNARKELTGDKWASSWAEWSERLNTIRTAVGVTVPVRR